MSDRQNAIACSFDLKTPRINAYQSHEWLYDKLHLNEDDIRVIQIDGPLRKVYIKFVNTERMMDVLQPIKGDLEFHHENEELSKVSAEIAGVGIRCVRVAALPPEVTEEQIRKTLSKYGDMTRITDEICSQVYIFHVKTGVRLVDIDLH